MSPLEALVALNSLPKIGPIRTRRLIDCFGDAAAVFKATRNQYLDVPGIGPETADILEHWQDHADPAAEIHEASARGIHIITRDDADYPSPLRNAYDPPLLLYVWGDLDPRDRHAVAVVGSRRSSRYGTQVTHRFSYQLAQAGFTIISGLARGIDTAAHEAAIAADGRTVAVVGSGLACLYPPENLGLAQKIADGHGAVLSEFPLHTQPDKRTFPMRNRIVAAWCRALLVTECPEWSGALITANLANEYGKPVFAVPGPVDRPGSAGCNQLIRDGATLVSHAGQLCEDLGELPFGAAPYATGISAVPALPEPEHRIHEALGEEEATIDTLVGLTGLSTRDISSLLMKLEIKGLVVALPGHRYARR